MLNLFLPRNACNLEKLQQKQGKAGVRRTASDCKTFANAFSSKALIQGFQRSVNRSSAVPHYLLTDTERNEGLIAQCMKQVLTPVCPVMAFVRFGKSCAEYLCYVRFTIMLDIFCTLFFNLNLRAHEFRSGESDFSLHCVLF